jgi:hypothetical protein
MRGTYLNKRNLSFGVSIRVSGVSPSATQHKFLYFFNSQKEEFSSKFLSSNSLEKQLSLQEYVTVVVS